VIRDIVSGGVGLPWNLGLAALAGLSLLFTRVTLGVDGSLADAHHVIGSLVLTVISVAAAEVARPVRYLNVLLGAALLSIPFLMETDMVDAIVTASMGAALILLSIRSGPIRGRYGDWDLVIRKRAMPAPINGEMK